MEHKLAQIDNYQQMLREISAGCDSSYIRSLLSVANYYFEYLKEELLDE